MLDLRTLACGTLLASIAVSASPATAQEPVTWSGFYIGAHAAALFADADFSTNAVGAWATLPDQAAAVNAATSRSLSSSGGAFGAQLGYNHQFGAWVVGLEGDVAGTTNDESSTGGAIPPSGVTSFTQQAQLAWMATLRARLGVTMGCALFYVTGGAAFGDWDLYMRMAGGPDAAIFNSSTVQTGWTGGGGVEYLFTEHLSLKVEYLYADFGSVSGQSSFLPGAPTFLNEHKIDLTAQAARGGLNYRF
jgi:outer membrane immunogenic protein